MNITLIEPASHVEVVVAYLKMFLPHAESITVFAEAEVIKELNQNGKNDSVFLIAKPEQSNFCQFIMDTISGSACRSDLVVFTSNEAKDGTSLWHPLLKDAYLLVHNPMFTIRPFSISFIWTEPWRIPVLMLKMMKTRFSFSFRARSSNFTHFQNILFPDEAVTGFCSSFFSKELSSKNVKTAPFYGIEKINRVDLSGEVRIVVPGTIENKTRDYKIVAQIVGKLNAGIRVTLVLLGKVKDKRILQMLCQSVPVSVIIEHKVGGFSQHEYDEELRKATLAILPLRTHMRQGSVYEVQGRTCLSGSINDVTRFGIPFLYPEQVPIPEVLHAVSLSVTKEFDINSLLLGKAAESPLEVLVQNFKELLPVLNYPNVGIRILQRLKENSR